MSARRSFASGVFWNSVLMGVGWPLGVLLAVLVGRSLGPAGKGEYTVATTAGALFTTLLTSGIPAVISYFLGGRRAPQPAVVKTAVLLAGALSPIALGTGVMLDRTGWCAWVFGVPHLTDAMWVVLLGLPLAFAGMFLQFVMLAQGRSILFGALPGAGTLVQVLLVAGWVWRGTLTPFRAAAALVASQSLTAAALLVYQERQVRWWRAPLVSLTLGREMAHYGVLTHFGNLAHFLLLRTDVFLLGVLSGLPAVGVYSVAYGVAELLLLLPQRFGVLYLPRVAAQEPGHQADEVRQSCFVVFVGTVVAAAALSVAAPPAIRWMYGAAFAGSAEPFQLLLPGVCATAVSAVLGAFLSGAGRLWVTAGAGLAAWSLNVALNLVLIPRYGASGAAVASSVTYILEAVLLAGGTARLIRVRPLDLLAPPPRRVFAAMIRRAWQAMPR